MATTSALRRTIAKSFYNSIRDRLSEDIFYALTSHTTVPDPEFLEDSDGISRTEEVAISLNAITAHRVLPGGVSRVVNRRQWTKNSIYEGWSPSATNYYVLVREFVSGVVQLNVYKCLFSPGTPSTNPPAGAPVSPFSTVDGYWWQFLYTIDNSNAIRFLTAEFMPVSERVTALEAESISTGTARYRQLVVQRNAVSGGVYNLEIGSGYSQTQQSLTVYGFSPSVDSDFVVQRFIGTITAIDSDYTFSLVSPGIGYGDDMYIQTFDGTRIQNVTPSVAPGLGHGTDAAAELETSNVMLVSRNVPSGDFLPLAENAFGTLNLILNPIDASTGNIGERDFYIACKSFTINDSDENPFQPNDFIAEATASSTVLGKVVAVDNKRVYYLNASVDGDGNEVPAEESVPFLTEAEADTEGVPADYGVVRVNGGNFEFQEPSAKIRQLNARQLIFNSHTLVVSDIRPVAVNRAEDQIESMNFVFTF